MKCIRHEKKRLFKLNVFNMQSLYSTYCTHCAERIGRDTTHTGSHITSDKVPPRRRVVIFYFSCAHGSAASTLEIHVCIFNWRLMNAKRKTKTAQQVRNEKLTNRYISHYFFFQSYIFLSSLGYVTSNRWLINYNFFVSG